MLYAPSNEWTCHFPTVAIILTISSCYFIDIIAIFFVIPFLLFYSLLIYLGYRNNAIHISVDQEKLFVRQGLDPENEYNLREVSSFVVTKKRFKTIFQIKPWEWVLPNPNEPIRLVMLMDNGSEKLIFTYKEASPFKRSWLKFATKLELQTGKTIQIQTEEIESGKERGRL